MTEHTLKPAKVSDHEWLRPAADAFVDAHQYWHDAAESYHEPSDFRRHVDSLIQAARNVTFRLQSAKGEGSQPFDWYEGEGPDSWRSYLKTHPAMAWLHDARTEVTKRKGLGRNSYAIVARIEGYLKPPAVLLKVSAEMPTGAIVAKASAAIPKEYREHQALEVVRRWEPDTRPGEELLALLRDCLQVLDALLVYAAELSSGEAPELPSEFVKTVTIPPCLRVTPDQIPLLFAPDTGEQLYVGMRRQTATQEEIDAAGRRYGAGKPPPAAPDLPEDVESFALAIHHSSRRAFKKDGEVMPFAFLRSPDGQWETFGTLTDGTRGKYLIWRDLGLRTELYGYDAVVHTSESWLGKTPAAEIGPYFDISQAPDVMEFIVTSYEDSTGKKGVITSRIHRVGPVSILGKAKADDPWKEKIFFFDPIRRAWTMPNDEEE